MEDRDDHAARPTDGHVEALALLPAPAFVARLLGHAGLGHSAIERAASAHSEASSSWQDALALRCRFAGVRTRPLDLSVPEACATVEPGLPLATWQPPTGWIALLEARPERVRITTGDESERWITRTEFSALFDSADTDSLHEWLILEPTLPAGASAPGHGLPPFRRLVELVRPDRGDLLTIVLYSIFVGLLSLATPIAVQQLVNTVAFGGLVQPVVILALLLLAGLAFAGLLSVLQAYLAELIQRRVFVRTCVELADRLPRVDPDAFGERHGPELVNRFLDLATLQKTGAALLLDGTSVALQTLAGLLILSFYHPLMLGFSLILVASIVFVMLVLGRGATRTAIGESTAKYEVVGWMEELARHPATFRSRASRDWAMLRADALATSWVTARRNHFKIVLRQIIGSTGLNVLVSTLLLGLGGALVVSGQLTLGQLVASEIIVAAVVASFSRLGKQLESFYDMLASADKIGVLLDLPLERDQGHEPRRGSGPAELVTKDVEETTESGDVLFEGVSLHIAAGERIAISARDARAPSTLLDLLCGLRHPDVGYVTLDGEDLRELRLDALREQLVCVRQPEIFAGTLAENLRLGREGASTAGLHEALHAVGLLHEVRGMPDGLRTRVATNGWPLTRSQMSRLMIARAILGRPRVLALDDALVYLQGPERKQVIESVLGPDVPWTTLVVSTDPDILARCTRTIQLGPIADPADDPHAGTVPLEEEEP